MKELKKDETVYIIDNKIFFDFDEATDYSDKNPDKKLYRTKVYDEIKNFQRKVLIEERTPKEGIPFTEKEYKYIQEKLKDCEYLVILNKINYHDQNYIYMYHKTPSYSCAFLDLFKYNNMYAIDRQNIKFNTIDEFIKFVKEENKKIFY
jgi:hypothetical protein